jgi:hypothetical protein
LKETVFYQRTCFGWIEGWNKNGGATPDRSRTPETEEYRIKKKKDRKKNKKNIIIRVID